MFYSFELEQYLESLLPERDELLLEMEAHALRETIPVITPAVGNVLGQLVKLSRSQRILEIGTAIGYSTLWLARAAAEWDGQVVTLDMNKQRIAAAQDYFVRAGVSGRITPLYGDARKLIPTLTQEFDFIFIDGAKGEYEAYLELVLPLLRLGGMLVLDNVLFRGWVVPGAVYEEKYERMVSGLRRFLEQLSRHPQLSTSVLPLGDGLAISIRLP